MAGTRKLVAIMAVDVVGYSRQMGGAQVYAGRDSMVAFGLHLAWP
jgi:hypothetical protein